MGEAKRCPETVDVFWDGAADSLQCVKDAGHGVFYYTQKHPDGCMYPSEHRFVIEVEQDEPPADQENRSE